MVLKAKVAYNMDDTPSRFHEQVSHVWWKVCSLEPSVCGRDGVFKLMLLQTDHSLFMFAGRVCNSLCMCTYMVVTNVSVYPPS